MWAKGAAVGNAWRAAPRCPRSHPLRRRRIVHMSTAPGRSAPGPRGSMFFCPASAHVWAISTSALRNRPRINSVVRSERHALTRRCSVLS